MIVCAYVCVVKESPKHFKDILMRKALSLSLIVCKVYTHCVY